MMSNQAKKEEKRLIKDLRSLSKNKHFRGHYKIILNHGRFFSVRSEEHPFKGKNRNCYGNCTDIALNMSSFFYCEGLAAREGSGFNYHAWLVDSSGTLYEPTPTYQKGFITYYGMAFQTTFVRECLLQTNYYGIFANDLLSLGGEVRRWVEQDFIPQHLLIPW